MPSLLLGYFYSCILLPSWSVPLPCLGMSFECSLSGILTSQHFEFPTHISSKEDFEMTESYYLYGSDVYIYYITKYDATVLPVKTCIP